MGFTVYLLAGKLLEILNLIKSSRQKNSYTACNAVYCYMAPLISLNYFVKNYAREAHLEAYLEPSQTSDMKLFKKIASGFKPFLIFAKSSILDIRLNTPLHLLRSKCFIT